MEFKKNERGYIFMFSKKWKQAGAWILVSSMMIVSLPFSSLEVRATELETFVGSLTAPTINAGDERIQMPEKAGAEVRFCADYEQIIGEDGTIYTPIEDRTVKGFYEVVQGDEKVQSSEFTIEVPGQYTDSGNANAKPAVIPELQEWHGTEGDFFISGVSRIIVGNDELQKTAEAFAEDYKDLIGKEIKVMKGTQSDARIGDFYLTLTAEDKGLDKEGYIMSIDKFVQIEAEEPTGAYWATRTVLQILKQTGSSLPMGLTRDYPKYEVRAFSLDVGRKPFTMDALYAFAKNMSWYKMNSFQVHLSDNLIFHEDYPTIEEAIEHSYAGFRLESDVKNTSPEQEGQTATSEDVYYTKDEFRSFIQDSRIMGVDIVPEFDMPAHALPFTRAFQQYMTKKRGGGHAYLIEEIDIANEEARQWARDIWNDYFEGDNPVFDEGMTVHIGTDEYHGKDGQEGKELFRQFSDEMIEFVQSKKRTVRMWGSLSNKSGTTPVRSENVQLNIWNTGYANPQDMYNLGFDLINTLEGPNYIVPAAGYYNNYIDANGIYSNWKPNVMGNLTAKAGDDQMLGACYAIWHDSIDTRANGISQYDSFDRFLKPLPAYSAKLWGEAEDRNYSEVTEVFAKTGTAPNTNLYANVDYITSTITDYTFDETLEKDSSANGFDLTENQKNVELKADDTGKSLVLKGGESYAETPQNMDLIGEAAVLSMKVKMDADAQGEQILSESKSEFGTYGTYAFKAVQKHTGKVGFSREGYDYSFNYTLPKDQWVNLEFCSGKDSVSLYVNGELIDNKHYDGDGELATTLKGGNPVVISKDNNPDIYYANHEENELSEKLAKEGITKIATMLVPLGRIGSKTKSFKGQIANVTVTGAKETSGNYGKVSQENLTATACSQAASDVTAAAAIDGNESTFWHSSYSGNDTCINDHGYHTFTLTLDNPTTIDTLTYLPRQNSENGQIWEYSIEIEKADGTVETVADHQRWERNYKLKTAEFPAIEAKIVRLLIHDAGGDSNGTHGTIAELNLYQPISVDSARQDLNSVLNDSQEYDKNDYLDLDWNQFLEAQKTAQIIKDNENSTAADCIYAMEQLQQAASKLTAVDAQIKTGYTLAAEIDKAEEQLKVLEGTTAFDTMQQAIQAAKDALLNGNGSGGTDLSEVLDNLQNEGNTADTKIDQAKTSLRNLIAKAKNNLKVTTGYTTASVKALQEAVNTADVVLAKSDATLKELEDAAKTLSSLSLVKDNSKTDNGLKDNDTFESNGIKYQVVSTSALTAKLIKGKDTAKLTIDTVSYSGKTYKIVEIGDKAFNGCKKKLKKVTIGANVETIGKNAFKGCKKLNTVTVKNKSKLKKVGSGAFKKTAKGISIKLPKTLKKNKNLKKLIQKAGIKKIK